MRHYIPKLSADTIKQQVPPSEFFQSEIDLQAGRNHGWVNGGRCPFHSDNRPGSFYVNLDSGGFNCFSCGSKGGDVIAFLMRRDDLAFPEALRYLHNYYGVG